MTKTYRDDHCEECGATMTWEEMDSEDTCDGTIHYGTWFCTCGNEEDGSRFYG